MGCAGTGADASHPVSDPPPARLPASALAADPLEMGGISVPEGGASFSLSPLRRVFWRPGRTILYSAPRSCGSARQPQVWRSARLRSPERLGHHGILPDAVCHISFEMNGPEPRPPRLPASPPGAPWRSRHPRWSVPASPFPSGSARHPPAAHDSLSGPRSRRQ